MGEINGLQYIQNFLSQIEQNYLIEEIDKLEWSTELKRRTQQYGYKYDYTKKSINADMKVDDFPSFIDFLKEKIPNTDQLIINEYLPGQGIYPHIDCISCFEDKIYIVSLLSTYTMNFQRYSQVVNLDLGPGSLLVLEKEARYKWTHGIIPRKFDENRKRERRISLTFRKVILN